jgi:putative transposase
MKRAKRIELRQLCRLAQVSRAGFYRWRKRPARPADADVEVRDAIQRIALEFPCYGSRRVGFELERRGYTVNRKRVQRLMREDNLLCLRRRKFIVTTDSNHNLPVYANLAATLALTRVDQLWVADISVPQ